MSKVSQAQKALDVTTKSVDVTYQAAAPELDGARLVPVELMQCATVSNDRLHTACSRWAVLPTEHSTAACPSLD